MFGDLEAPLYNCGEREGRKEGGNRNKDFREGRRKRAKAMKCVGMIL